MARHFAYCTVLTAFIWTYGSIVMGMPAPQSVDVASTTATATSSSTKTTASVTATPTSGLSSQTSPPSTTRTIILVVVFCVIPLIGLWLCCHRSRYSCCSRKEKRQHYNAAYPAQIPGGVYLVPVNQFVPPDPKMGYAVRVDTPLNPTDAATPAPPIFHEIIMPQRAASPPGKANEKIGGWSSLFKA